MNSYVRAIAKRGPVAGVIVAVGSTSTSCIAAAIRAGYAELDCTYQVRSASQGVDDCADDPDLPRRVREADRRRFGWTYEMPAPPALAHGSSYETREHYRRVGPNW